MNPAEMITCARKALVLESQGLEALAQDLGEPFCRAVALLQKTQGRVVVCGMGKSGHIARKIAATLSSTGTPSLFLHPGEASHGDLGMVCAQDTLLMLSYSGETEELLNPIRYALHNHIPLIAITAGAKSALALSSTVPLILPKKEEACPMGLAPTTSTTMMLALGDALAVTLLQAKNFTPTHFKVFHPGGNLGRQLLRVGDLMHRGEAMPLVGEEALMEEAVMVMTAKAFGSVGVLNAAGHLRGVITDGDLRRHMSAGLLAQKVVDIMTPNPLSTHPGEMGLAALDFMREQKITSLFVKEIGDLAPVGILHIHDLLRAKII